MNNSLRTKSVKSGFTLIEILVVVALIAILAAITIIAINPARNFAAANDAKRSSDVTAILNAVTQYTSEQGNSIDDLETGDSVITTCPTSAAIGTLINGSGPDNVNLATNLVDTYLVAIPMDPDGGTAATTGYTICQTAGGRVQVSAPNAENGTISVTR